MVEQEIPQRRGAAKCGKGVLIASTLAKHARPDSDEPNPGNNYSAEENPTDESDIDIKDSEAVAQRLKALSRALDRGLYRLIYLIPAFDRQQGWQALGYRSCIGWLNAECGISPSAAYDRRRVAYALEKLPIIRELFRTGELSWSKVRALTRVATTDNERELAGDALVMSASQIEQSVRQHRDVRTREDIANENERTAEQYHKRALHTYYDQDGMLQVHAKLPPLEGAAFLKSLHHAEDVLFADRPTVVDELDQATDPDVTHRVARHRRADALCLVAEAHMALQDASVRNADRYQVVIHADAGVLHQTHDNPDPDCDCRADKDSSKKPLACHIQNGSALSADTLRRITSDCTVLPIIMRGNEPVSIGRKSRVWATSIDRAIKTRDCHCQFPGCDATRQLQIHHLKHWALGGETSVEGGVTLCAFHHRLLHERQLRIEKTPTDEQGNLPVHKVVGVDVDGCSIELESRARPYRVIKPDGTVFG